MSNNFFKQLSRPVRMRAIFGCSFFLVFFLGIAIVFGIASVIGEIIGFFMIFVLAAGIVYAGYRLSRRGGGWDIRAFLVAFFGWYAVVVASLLGVVGCFVVYHTMLAPATLPTFVISNGEKTIIFQTMSHVASESFYDTVGTNIREAKEGGFFLFYEWVNVESSERLRDFSRAVGVDLGPDFYTGLAMLSGLFAQQNENFLGIVDDRDQNVDLSLDRVMTLYEARLDTGPLDTSAISEAPVSSLTETVSDYERLPDAGKRAVQLLVRATLNFALKNEAFASGAIEGDPSRHALFEVVLDERDAHIAEAVLASEHEKIMLLYGLLHFNGIYERLREADPDYRILNVVEYHPFR